MIQSLFEWLRSLFVRTHPSGQTPFAAGTGPARLLVIRHAEKTGDKRDKHLSEPGWLRAEKLATYIPQTFGKPDFLIAASNSKKSKRPFETLKPLATSTGVPIWADLDDEEISDLIDVLSRTAEWRGKFGIISWRHASLPPLIAALGAPEGTFPDPWNSDTYDLSIEIVYADTTPAVRQIKQPF